MAENENKTERDPVELTATEFLEQRRRAKAPSIDQLSRQYPESAESIRELLPLVGVLERLREHRDRVSGAGIARGVRNLERLGDYRIIRELGRGGMGVVFEAEQESLERRVAVKVMPKLPFLNEKRQEQFRREARVTAKLHHTHIVPVFGVGHHEEYHYYVMQLIHGVGLDDLVAHLRVLATADAAQVAEHRNCRATVLARALLNNELSEIVKSNISDEVQDTLHCDFRAHASSPASGVLRFPRSSIAAGSAEPSSDLAASENGEQPVSSRSGSGQTYWRNVAEIGRQAAEALHYAHRQNTLHRDLKPGNLLLDMEGAVWIADFGLARVLELDQSLSGDMVGTLRYMAPEEFTGGSDARSDQYSLGITLYEMLTLTPAFSAERRGALIKSILENRKTAPRRINPAIPRDLETIVLKATAHAPGDRYPSAEVLAEDLARFLNDRPIRARRTNAVEHLWRWARRNRSLATLAALTLFSLVLLACVSSRAYLRAKYDNRRVAEALVDVARQRQRAENVSQVALSSLDNIFAQLSPTRVTPDSDQVITGVKGDKKVSFVFSEQTAALLQQMLIFYDDLTERVGGSAALTGKRGQANRRLGYTRSMMGQYAAAEAHYRAASEMYHGLIQRAEDPEPFLGVTVEIQSELGEIYWAMDEPGKAIECFRQALGFLESLPEDIKEKLEYRFQFAQTHYLLRKRLATSRYPAWLCVEFPGLANSDEWWGDEANLEQATKMAVRLVEEDPGNPNYRHLLGKCYRDRFPEEGLRGQLPPDQRASELLEQLVTEYPDVSDYRYDLALAYAAVNRFRPDFDRTLYDEQLGPEDGEVADATGLERAILILDEITRENPNTVRYIEDLASLHHLLGEFSVITGTPKTSQYMKAEGLLLPLEERFPEVASYRVWRAIVQLTMAPMRTSNPDYGFESFESGVAALEAVAEVTPMPDSVANLVSRSATELAEMLAEKGYEEEAAQVIHVAERARLAP